MKKQQILSAVALTALLAASAAFAADKPDDSDKGGKTPARAHYFEPEEKVSEGSVTTNHQQVNYKAVAGTLVVHAKGWEDAPVKAQGGDDKTEDKASAEAVDVLYRLFQEGRQGGKSPDHLHL